MKFILKQIVNLFIILGFVGLGMSGYLHFQHPRYGRKIVTSIKRSDEEEKLFRQGKALYQKHLCMRCHGGKGQDPQAPLYPVVSGQPFEYILTQLLDIRDHRRVNGMTSIMAPSLEGVRDGDLEKIAYYLSQIPFPR